ncbi:MAG: hypothetical protein WB799_14460, partial [Candidatus Sulfotelmatobacter sp.]
MVWSITGAESYVRETGKSMKAAGLAVAQDDFCCGGSGLFRLFRRRDLNLNGVDLVGLCGV